jgi:hypothetical protein
MVKRLKTPVNASFLSPCLSSRYGTPDSNPCTLESLSLSLSLSYLSSRALVFSIGLMCTILNKPSSTTKQSKLLASLFTFSSLFPHNAQLSLFNTLSTNPTNASLLLVNFVFLKWVCSSFHGCFSGFSPF